MTLLLFAGLLVWFVAGVATGYGYKGHYQSTGTSGGTSQETGSIYPVAWIPPFMRNDWVIEEVVEGKEVYHGNCPDDLQGDLLYFDKTIRRNIEVHFALGTVTARIV